MTQYNFQLKAEEQFPSMVHIENTNVCNLRCIHCPQSFVSKRPGYKPQFLDYKLIQKVIDEVAANNSIFRITADGEPMIQKKFKEMVDYVYEKGAKIFAFNTNGTLMNQDIIEKLVWPSERTKIIVEVSLDAFYKDTYDKVRVKSDYVKVMFNIFNFLRIRKERKASNIKLVVSIIDQPEALEEIEDFKRFWGLVVDDVVVRKYVDTKGLMPAKNQRYDKNIKRWPCLVVFKRIMVGYDGRVRFCPDDWKKESVIGDIRKNTLKEIWQSEEYKKLRQEHLTNNLAKRVPCNYCKEWQALDWNYNYEQVIEKLFHKI